MSIQGSKLIKGFQGECPQSSPEFMRVRNETAASDGEII